MNRIINIANQLLSLPRVTGVFIFISITISIFGVAWGVINSMGIKGSPMVFVSLSGFSLFAGSSLLLLSLFRWQLMRAAILRNMSDILQYDPNVVIGIGIGGAIVGAIISRELEILTKREARFASIDRTYINSDNQTKISVSKLMQLCPGLDLKESKVLLVAAEVHTGLTMKAITDLFNGWGADNKSYSLILAPNSNYNPDISVINSSARGILPWNRSTARRFTTK